MVCGFGGICLRTAVLSVSFLTPTSQPNDMLSSLYTQVLSGFASNNVTTDTEIRVMTSPCLPCTQGWEWVSVLCFAAAPHSLPRLLRDSIDLNVGIHTGPLFREEGDEGASWRPFPRILTGDGSGGASTCQYHPWEAKDESDLGAVDSGISVQR